MSDREYLNRILLGEIPITGEMEAAIAQGAPAGAVAIMNGIDAGDIRVEGGLKEDVERFFGYFDPPVDVGSIRLIVR